MTRSTRLVVLSSLAAALVLTAGCDDDPAAPEDTSFALTVTVLDADGDPLADAPVVIIPALPPGVLQDGKAAAMRAAVTLPFTLPGDCRGDLTIVDVAGTPVRQLLVAHELPAGRHAVVWNGQDDEGNAMNTGWYTAILVCRDAATGALVYEGQRHLLLIHVDGDRTPFRTGDDGTVTITDRRIVPAFWTLPPVRHVDESATLIQEFALTTSTEIRAAGARITVALEDGPQEVTVQASALAAPAQAAPVVSAPLGAADGDDPVPVIFGDPYPNPFN